MTVHVKPRGEHDRAPIYVIQAGPRWCWIDVDTLPPYPVRADASA